jgi:DNA-binding response OmpR family regulator
VACGVGVSVTGRRRVIAAGHRDEFLNCIGGLAAEFSLSVVPSPELALFELGRNGADAVIIDATLPGLDAGELCALIHRRCTAPVVVTVGSEEPGVARLLECGADDVLRQPVPPLVLRARVAALIRRLRGPLAAPRAVTAGRLVVQVPEGSARLDGEELDLDQLDRRLLARLAERPNFVVGRKELLGHVEDLGFSLVDIEVRLNLLAGIVGAEALHRVPGQGWRLAR